MKYNDYFPEWTKIFYLTGYFYLCLFLILYVLYLYRRCTATMWISNGNNQIDVILSNVLYENNIQQTYNNKDWTLYIPSSYDNVREEIDKIVGITSFSKIFIMDNADQLCCKNHIWTHLVNKYGRTQAQNIMPTTYVLYNYYDMELFEKEYNQNTIYILKKNIQQQKGLLITKNKNDILNGFKNNYVIVQDLLQDPYLINGRKINMRFYLLIICDNGQTTAYVFNDGFMYYTKNKFTKGTMDSDTNITTGYIDRQVYIDNPLTHGDFREHLNTKYENKNQSNVFFISVNNLLSNVVIAVKDVISRKDNKIWNTFNFQLFGVDIAVSDTLQPKLMEINKGPDLGVKDDRDKIIKTKLISDLLEIINLKQMSQENGYVQIF